MRPKSLPLLGLASLLAASQCRRSAPPPTAIAAGPPPVAVTLATTELQPVDLTVAVVGTLFGDEELTIAAKQPGRVVRVLKDVGDRVGFGAALVQIDRGDYELAVAQARAALEEALAKLGLTALPTPDFDPATLPSVKQARLEAANVESRYRRAEQMFHSEPPVVSEQDVADQKTAWEVAQNRADDALLQARWQVADALARQVDLAAKEHALEQTTVRAPSAEEVGATAATAAGAAERYAIAQRMVSAGEYVKEGTPLFRLVADHALKYRASAPERFLHDVALGQQVRLEGAAGPITRINPQVSPVSRTFEIEVALGNDDGRLRAGSFAKGEVIVGNDPAATFAPQDAIVSFLGTKKVFVVRDGKAAEIAVKTGVRRGALVQILEGLAGRHEVVVSGATRLANGTAVTVRPAAEPR